MGIEQTVSVISTDDYPVCLVCYVRLTPDIDPFTNDNRVVDEDEDGPIHAGTCMDHGAFLFQFEPEEQDKAHVPDDIQGNTTQSP